MKKWLRLSLLLLVWLLAGSAAAQDETAFKQNVPFNARLAYETAVKRLKANQTDEALAKLTEAVNFFPDYFNARFLLAAELSKRNRTQEALQELEHARRINDRYARVYRLFGLLMAEQRKFVVAEFSFREAIQGDPAHALTWHSHAVALIEMALTEPDAHNAADIRQAIAKLKR